MHVAHFIHRYPPALGGAEAYCARLTEFLVGRGHVVQVWTSNAIELEEMWQPRNPNSPQSRREHRENRNNSDFALRSLRLCGENDFTVRRFPPLGFPGRRYILKALSLIPHPRWQSLTMPCNPVCLGMWREAAKYEGPLDAVHAFAFPYSFPIACGLKLARRRGVPFFLTPFLHLGDPTDPHNRTRKQYTSRPLRWLSRQADGVFVQTESEFDAVVQLGVPSTKVTLQGLGVDSQECTGGDRAAIRQTWGVTPDTVVLGHLANNSVEKGTVDLLRTVQQLPDNARIVLAGPEMPNFRRFWDAFPLKDRVIRMGQISDAMKRDFFAGIDAFVLPSRTDSFGLVLLEAWANGKPVVVYRAGGPGDLVRDGDDGLQVRCGDVNELSEKLRVIVNDVALRERLGKVGADRVRTEFQWADKLACVERVLRGTTPTNDDSWALAVTQRQ